MVFPTDSGYKKTKRIKRGRASLPEKFAPLASWIADQFGCVAPLNIVTDKTVNRIPRLQIIFEYEADAEKFRSEDGFQFDEAKQQAVMEQFRATISRPRFFGLDHDRMFAIFSSFERAAREEANSAVRVDDIAAVRKWLGASEVWEIKPLFDCVTFMFFTDEQIKESEDTGFRELCVKAYSSQLAYYDEFGYFEQRPIQAYFSSKETFERDYQGNWGDFFR